MNSPVITRTCLLLLLTFFALNDAHATLFTYHYVGSTYTRTNGPGVAGFTFCDRVTAEVTLDSAYWGTTVNSPINGYGLIISGPWQVGADAFRITTDSAGRILAWSLSGAIPGLDISTGGSADGSGYDDIFGDRPSQGQVRYGADVFYSAGSRAPGSAWVRVPDRCSTLLLFSLSLVPLLCFGQITRKQGATRNA